MLEQIIYMSALGNNSDESCLKDILSEAVAYNSTRHITGILLYINGSFLQVLEGASDDLAELYRKIGRDPRHKALLKIAQKPIEKRQFGEWSMGSARMAAFELDRIIGGNDFFTRGHCLTELEDSLVKRILENFKEGQWRRRIE